jgi:hypothetical protein
MDENQMVVHELPILWMKIESRWSMNIIHDEVVGGGEPPCELS